MIAALLSYAACAQDSSFVTHWQQQQQLNKQGMYILGGWALGNIALGALQQGRTQGVAKSFHQMNVYWNLFNLGLVSATLLIRASAPATLAEALAKQHNTEKLFLANAALDLAYMAGGLYLTERSRRAAKPAQLQGFGRSVILQGGFLFVFDVVMYLVQHRHGNGLLKNASLQGSAQGVSLTLTF